MITFLTLANFRNHESFRIETGGAKLVVLSGPNGSGKTAVLEAISMFCPAPTLRSAVGADILRHSAAKFSVFAELIDGTRLSIEWSGQGARRLRVDSDARQIADTPLKLAWITTKEDRLFLDSSESRRNFFDRLASSWIPRHAGNVAQLNKLLNERRFALQRGADCAWLDSIDKNLAAAAVAVEDGRAGYLEELNENLTHGSLGRIKVYAAAGSSRGCCNDGSYFDYLRANRFLVAGKMSIDGPHKTDFICHCGPVAQAVPDPQSSRAGGVLACGLGGGVAACADACRNDTHAAQLSTGQQKSLLLRIVSAHAKLCPNLVLLLDEALSHLDESAVAAFFSELEKLSVQIWLTGVNSVDLSDACFVRL